MKKITYKIVQTYPHIDQISTQGLYYQAPYLYESSGGIGKSLVRKIILENNEIEREIKLPDFYYAEGLTVVQNKLYLLTWRSQKGFILDRASLEYFGEFSYDGQGWGLTHSGDVLYKTNGSNLIDCVNVETMNAWSNHLEVVNDVTRPVNSLNEIEFVESHNVIYANVFTGRHQNSLLKINASNGQIISILDLEDLLEREGFPGKLNGVAYKEDTNTFLITGKNWKTIYEISIE